MADPNLNTALKWAIENTSGTTPAEGGPRTQLNADALAALFGNRKSDADYMKESMAVIQDEEAQIENRLQAFDNLEQLIENLDNANNMEPLGLWVPLVKQLENKHAGLRSFAAWCCSTAVQNNIRTQERVSNRFCSETPPTDC
jgi:hsp70-interacting protein